MTKNVFNNGYLIKALYDDPNKLYPPGNPCYRGIGKFVSWPLEECDDDISVALTKEAWERWFGFQDVLEVVPEREYLERYIGHCEASGIETSIMMIETPSEFQRACDFLEVVECLGYDIVSSVEFSHLTMDTDYLEGECSAFREVARKLNSNGLYDSLADAYRHMEVRKRLLSQGVNLEIAHFGPFPARISVVKLG
ncbi:MAG TPA: hypothetical protein DEB24_03995 [Coriobacteriia bacterium]|nr:hypothetical protein [Coriobacteriia bacterium]